MIEKDLAAFCRRIQTDVADRIAAGNVDGGPYSENAFTGLVADYLSEVGMIEAPLICHFEGVYGRGQAKVEISGFAMTEDEVRLDLFTTIYRGASEAVVISKEEVARAAGRAAKFFEAAVGGIHANLEPASPVAEMAARIQQAAPRIEKVRVYVLTDGVASAKGVAGIEMEGTAVTFDVFDIVRLFKGVRTGEAREPISVDLVETFGAAVPCLQMPTVAENYTAYLAIIPGELLYRLYEEYGSRLLERNVRAFLSVRGKVNKGIRETLLKEPASFLAYNNGIVVTVENLRTEVLPDGRTAIRSVTDLQIVNGGQTMASIHRARKIDKADLSLVQVPAKISKIKPEKLDDMVQRISQFANSQNTVQPADFSANDPYHIKIAELSESVWCPGDETRWFYERARGSYQVALAREGTKAKEEKFKQRTPVSQRFAKTDLAKYLNVWDQKPHLVGFGAQKNFDHFMQGLRASRADGWEPDVSYYRRLIAKAILWRAAHAIVRQEKECERVISQPANVTAYLVSYLAWATGGNLNLDLIWNTQQVSAELSALLRTWAVSIDGLLRDGARGRMVSEWAKKEQCWGAVKEVRFPLPEKLPIEFSTSPSNGDGRPGALPGADDLLTSEDMANIEVCKGLDGNAWLEIHAWGKRTGELKSWQSGIAHTLAGYAAGGWAKGPSKKQAKHAADIISISRAAGIPSGSE